MSRCLGCFKEESGQNEKCPHCGFIIGNYEQLSFALRPGTVLKSRYMIGRRLGEGGFGITYLAWDEEMQERVAIKEYYPEGIAYRDVTSKTGDSVITSGGNSAENYDDGMRRYVREAAILAKFSRLPGIVLVKDFFYENSTAYIVMEYIDGISLKEYLKQHGNRLDYRETLELVRPVISSLATIHQNNLLHRDISPDNIMIDKMGQVKLIDFGAARQFGNDENRSLTVVLKHGYAPLEQYSRHGEQGAWTDVYAICAVIYKCLTGVTPVESIERAGDDRYVPVAKAVKGLPAGVAGAIDKGLAVHHRDRYRNLNELYNDLYSSGTQRVLRKHSGVIQGAIIAFTALAAVLVLILAVVLFLRGNGNADSSDYDQSYESDADSVADSREDAKEGEDTEENLVYPEWMNTEKVTQGILVVSEGVLDGYSTDVTVNDILIAYSDEPGSWRGYEDGVKVIVFYSGKRKGEDIDFIFEVYQNDTFKLAGAGRKGKKVTGYSAMFKECLKEYGL